MSPRRLTWMQDEYAGGIDLRDGAFSRNQERFRELLNVRVTKGRKIERRPPVGRVDGTLDTNTQGLVSIDGVLHVLAKKGDTIVHTGAVAGEVTTLFFDAPEYTTSWSLLAAGVFEGVAVAAIRHTHQSTAFPALVQLHVFDGLAFSPTYVGDPEFPGLFSPSIDTLLEQEYDAGFVPVLGFGASKAWSSTLNGNALSSRTADARVWNQRTSDSFLEDGEHWCFIVPEGNNTLRYWTVPRPAADLPIDQRWAYYVLERAVDGVFVPMTEVAATVTPTVGFTWRPISVPSRFAGGPNEVQIELLWGQAAAGIIRLRLVAGATAVEPVTTPTVTISGAGLTRNVNTTTIAELRYRGGDKQTFAAATAFGVIAQGNTYLVSMTPTGMDLWNETALGFPSGFEREKRRILRRIVWPALAADPDDLGTAGTAYSYAFEADENSAFFTNLVVEYTDLAGAEDAVGLASSAHDNTGSRITAIASIRDRMLISYEGSLQLWAIDQDTSKTAFLDALSFGTGDQLHPSPIPFYGSLIVPMVTGFRAISLVQLNTDSLQDLNVGEPIEDLPMIDVLAGCFWPFYGQSVVGGLRNGALVFMVLDYSREAKITAWSQWEVAGITSIDAETLIPDLGLLHFRSGEKLLRFDAEAAVFRDFADTPGAAYLSKARPALNHMGHPGRTKRFVGFDIIQQGQCSVFFELPLFGTFDAPANSPDLANGIHEGTTYGRTKRPLALISNAIAMRLESRDERGWLLEGTALDYLLLDR